MAQWQGNKFSCRLWSFSISKSGFKGPIYTSYETGEVFTTMVEETYEQMQNETTEKIETWKKEAKEIRKENRAGKKDRSRSTESFDKKTRLEIPEKPTILYTIVDIKNCYSQLRIMETENSFSYCPGLDITFFPNAHILGAICVFVRAYTDDEELCFLITGDLGITNPLSQVKTKIPKEIRNKVNFVISESTYGAEKMPRKLEDEREKHAEILNEYLSKKGTVVYMSNSLERPEILALDLKRMQNDPRTSKVMKNVPIYLDTTLGITCLKKYIKILGKDFLPKNWQLVTKDNRINVMAEHEARIIICTSPMFYRGSFKCYGKKILQNPDAALIFVAYVDESVQNIIQQEQGYTFTYDAETIVKKCLMHRFYTYSSHASKKELKKFILSFKNCNLVLLQHGSFEAKEKLAKEIQPEREVLTLKYGKTVVVGSKGLHKVYYS